MLQLTDLSFRRGPRLLLAGASVTVYPGHKVGLVGPNGCGKSSLFALLRGELHADAGDWSVPAGWQMAHVAQHTPDSLAPAIEFVLDGDPELRRIQAELAAADAAGMDCVTANWPGIWSRSMAMGGSRAARLLRMAWLRLGGRAAAGQSYSGGWRIGLHWRGP